MSESLPMPTRGPVSVFYNDEAVQPFFVTTLAKNNCEVVLALLPEITQQAMETGRLGGTIIAGMGQANADLIAAAFSAAEDARQMGFDPIAAVQALPLLLSGAATADRYWTACIDAWSANGGRVTDVDGRPVATARGDNLDELADLASIAVVKALAAARTRDTTTGSLLSLRPPEREHGRVFTPKETTVKRRLFIVQFGPAGKSTRSMFVLARNANDAGAFADQQVQHGEKVVITEVTEPVYDAIDQLSAPCLYEGLPITPPPAPRIAN